MIVRERRCDVKPDRSRDCRCGEEGTEDGGVPTSILQHRHSNDFDVDDTYYEA